MAGPAWSRSPRLWSRRRVALIVTGLLLLATSLGPPSRHWSIADSLSGGELTARLGRSALARTAGDAPPRRAAACRKEFEGILPLRVAIPVMAALILTSGMFTGLTLGLMGMDTIGLQIIKDGEDPALSRRAAKIIGIRKNGNQLMCTLLLGNVTANAALAILAADTTTNYYGLLISVCLILLLGEILPQAICTKYTLQVGAAMVPVAYFFMFLFWIITKPLSLLLMPLLGKEMEFGSVRSRTELIEKLQALGRQEAETGAALADQIAKQVAEGARSFRTKCAAEVMTPIEDAFMLASNERLGYSTIREIFETGFTRIPVCGADKHEIVGLLVTKDLMLADPEDEMQVGDFIKIFNRKVEAFSRETHLVEVLNKFKNGGTHMGLVRELNQEKEASMTFEICGVITLEDVIEEILQEDIVDETDVYKDVDNQVKVNDGRETRVLNLGVFNPLWRSRQERLSRDQVAIIAAHLQRTTFSEGQGLSLSYEAIEWLVTKAGVQNRERSTPWGHTGNKVFDADVLYELGKESNCCTLILQGRVSILAGVEKFPSEVGAFTVLARDALFPGDIYLPDFVAYVHTQMVRIVIISKVLFLEALALDRDKPKLAAALEHQASEVLQAEQPSGRTSLISPRRAGWTPWNSEECPSPRFLGPDTFKQTPASNRSAATAPISPREPPQVEVSTKTYSPQKGYTSTG